MSAPTLEHTSSSVEHFDQLSQTDLLDRREQIDAQLDTYDADLNEYFNKLEVSNDPQLAVIAQLQADQESDANRSNEGSIYRYMVEHGEGFLSSDLIDTFKKIEELESTEEKVLTQLDTRFASGLMEYAREEALEIFSNLDYVAVGELAKNKSPDLPDSDGIRLRWNEETLPRPQAVVAKLHEIAYDEHANLNYRYAELQVDEIERCKEILERWGIGTQKPLVKPVYDHTELERAKELNNRYRNYHGEVSAIEAESKPLLPMHEWAVNLPDAESAKYYERLASIDIDGELERVHFDGLDLLPFYFSDTELRDYIRSHIPAIALEGLSNVVFRKATEDEKTNNSHSEIFNGKGVTIGHHDHSLSENNAEIVIFVDKFQNLHEQVKSEDSNSDSEFADWYTKSEVLNTLAHEFGHALHHTLPVGILHEWDDVADSEHVAVTDYVSEMKLHDHRHKYMEDFADSFRMYANAPRRLQSIAGQRYVTMQSIVTKLKAPA